MKKIIYLLMTGLFWSASLQAGYLVNNGSDIVISSGTSVVINGDFENKLDGTIDNSGTILIDGNWINNATSGDLLLGTSGDVIFNGSSTQYIQGTSGTYFNNLDLQNDVVLQYGASVSGQFTLNNTFLTLNNNYFVLQPSASIVGANPTGYIITNGGGAVERQVGGSDVVFPVGSTSYFAPVVLNNSGGTTDTYNVTVFNDVLTNGTSGSTIANIDDCVDMTWVITEGINGGSDLDITTYWPSALEGPNFDRNHAGMGHYTGGAWDPMEEVIASGANPYSITRSGISSLSPFAVGDLESPMAVEVQLRIDLKVFLEGPYAGSGSMNTNLNSNGYIPLSQPYNPALPYYDNASPVWQYAGTESVPSIPAGTVDWVVVQLRDATAPGNATSATIIGTQAAFVLDDGTIVALDGASTLTFNVNFSQNLYAVVFHRNHLGIISNNALTPSAGIYSYDFTSGEFQAYGGANGHKEIEPGVWGMISADGNGNGLIQNTDETAVWKADLGNSGYMGGDFNMNGLTQNTDETDYWKVNLGAGGQTPSKANTGYKSQVPN